MGKSKADPLKKIWEEIETEKKADAKVNSFMTFSHKTGLLQNSLEKWLNLIKTSNVSQLEWNYAYILPVISLGLTDDDQALVDFLSFWHIFWSLDINLKLRISLWTLGLQKWIGSFSIAICFFLARFVVQHVSCWSGNTKSTAFPQEFGHLVSNSLPEFKHAKYKDGGDARKKREK